MHFIAKKQDIELPDQLANNIAEKSKRCLQQAIRSFEATWHSKYARLSPQLPAFILNQLIINTTQVNKWIYACSFCFLTLSSFDIFPACYSYPFKEEQLVLTGWEKEIADIATSIIEEQSSKRLGAFAVIGSFKSKTIVTRTFETWRECRSKSICPVEPFVNTHEEKMYLEDEDITKEAYLASGFYSLIFLLYAGCFFSDKSFKFCCSTICVPNLFFL